MLKTYESLCYVEGISAEHYLSFLFEALTTVQVGYPNLQLGRQCQDMD
jgi:hypothetical protein